MNIYFIRHGMPDYKIDSLTELGKYQADHTSDYLKNIPFDMIFSSTLGRAYETAQYLAKKINKEIIKLEWAIEDIAGSFFAPYDEKFKGLQWFFWHSYYLNKVIKQSNNPLWYEHEDFKDTKAKEGVLFYRTHVNEWLESLGIKHEHNMYTRIEGKDIPANIAFFAHGGMAMAFLSTLLDVPYSYFCTHFNCLDTCGVVHIYIDTDNHVARIISYNEVHYDNSLFVKKNEVKF